MAGRWRRTLSLIVTATCLNVLIATAQGWAGGRMPHEDPPARAAIAIIIDDLGNRLRSDRRAVDLRGAVACAILPHGPYSRVLAERAHRRKKEVLLHAPMESLSDRPAGPGMLFLNMTRGEFAGTLTRALASVPHVSGINNHMGSLLTQHPGHMTWLMQEMRRHGLRFFIDSRTTPGTIARRMASENGIPNSQRDVFLDNVVEPEAISAAFDRLLELARRNGTALAIGHPYPQTMDVLEGRLRELDTASVELVPVARLIDLQRRRIQPWLTYSSH